MFRTLLFTIFLILNAAAQSAAIQGKVTDHETNRPISRVEIRIVDLHRWTITEPDGSFFFDNIPFGQYELTFSHVSYWDQAVNVTLPTNEDTLRVRMLNSHMTADEVVVTGEIIQGSSVSKPDIVINQNVTRENLGTTIAETIENEPGLSTRSMGTAPSRPVLRGLGGDRLLLLEDGANAGDMSATSADHAVAIDPLTSDHIEIIRGPRGFLFGSNVIGGVVNVVRNMTPFEPVKSWNGSLSLQSMSVNDGVAFGGMFNLPLTDFLVKIDGSVRNAGNTKAPDIGNLKNTYLNTQLGGIGVTWFQPWGSIGSAVNVYGTDYGIPPDSAGHLNGVDIQMDRLNTRTRARIHFDQSIFHQIDVGYTFSRYKHTEFESGGLVGQQFFKTQHDFEINLHERQTASHRDGHLLIRGEFTDFRSGGRSTMPENRSYGVAVGWYHEWKLSEPWSINISGRLDYVRREPFEPDNLYQERSFWGFSGGLSAGYDWSTQQTSVFRLLRTFRPPTAEDLFSNGPHLAAYAYEVGNPALESETGHGFEIAHQYQSDTWKLNTTVFLNLFNRFIYVRNTGRVSNRLSDLFVYEYTGRDAQMFGYEFQAGYQTGSWSLDASGAYVRGEVNSETGWENLPYIPPFEGKLSVTWKQGSWRTISSLIFATMQSATGQFEEETDGYAVMNTAVDYNLLRGGAIHTITLSVENLLDLQYRKHLNRVKESMPEPGRNIKLLYKLFF